MRTPYVAAPLPRCTIASALGVPDLHPLVLWFLAATLSFTTTIAAGQGGAISVPLRAASPHGSGRISGPVGTDQPLVLVLVDFPDGRLPDGRPPAQDAELALVRNLDAVGSMGYTRSDDGALRATANKYTYEDYWDLLFAPLYSTVPYVGARHPDYGSHEGYVPPPSDDPAQEVYRLEVFGSVRDYWDEVSYGNLQIRPFQTREYGRAPTKDNCGIVNNLIRTDGRTCVRWICLTHDKPEYSASNEPDREPINAAIERLRALHRDPASPEYIEFDVDAFTGKICIMTAGGRLGGWTFKNSREFIVSEKAHYLQNTSPSVLFTPIGGIAHEFGHTIGISHQAVGPYDLMHYGGLSLRRYSFCPPHVNPWLKLRMGWLTENDLVKVTAGQVVQLPPITQPTKTVALITLFGDAGRFGDYTHSEYFLVEYRKREKFNRYAGGPDATFRGGGLVWHFGSAGSFPFTGNEDIPQMFGLKVPNYGSAFKGNIGDPSHFFYSGNDHLDSSTCPSSCSIQGYSTGVTLAGFRENEESLRFTVSYTRAPIPVWDRFYRAADSVEFPFRGSVYVEGTRSVAEVSFAEGSSVQFAPGGGISTWNCTSGAATLQCNGGSYLRIRKDLTVKGPLTFRGTGSLMLGRGAALHLGDSATLTLEYGTTCGLLPGAYVQSGQRGIIIERGKLLARGNGEERVVFTSTSDGWSGLVLTGRGADSSIIEYADINNVQTQGGAAVAVIGAQGVSVRNCRISDNAGGGTHGLFFWNAGHFEVSNNEILANGGYGVCFVGSQGVLCRNWMASNVAGGAYCSDWASPTFGQVGVNASNGNNVITGGRVGVLASRTSFPCVGLAGSSSHGYNHIDDNSVARVSASENSEVMAQMNFWGEHPKSGQFVVQSGSAITWHPYLEMEPGTMAASTARSAAPLMDSTRIDIAAAARCRVTGEVLSAKRLLTCAAERAEPCDCAGRLAAEIVALYEETRDPELLGLCRCTSSIRKSPNAFALAEAKILLIDRQSTTAANRLAEVIECFPGTEYARTAALDMCFNVICEPGMPGNAGSHMNILQPLDAEDPAVRAAAWLFKRLRGEDQSVLYERRSPEPRGATKAIVSTVDAFPNPFNPLTQIEYRLADRAHVVMSVYDVRGRHVATLVDGKEEAGQHVVRFDGRGLSSGTYFCTLTTGGFTQTRRLVLLR